MLQNVKTEGRQTKLLAAIAVFAMVVCALAVVLPSAEVTDAYEATDVQNGTVTVSNETDLRQALADNTVSTIVLGDNITGVDSVLTVGKAVTIDGDGHTITAVESETFKGEWISGPSKYLISVEGSYNVSITDLILDNSGFAFGLNVYGATVILNGVDSINSAGAGFVIGGSGSINATDVSAADNTWGGINIDTSGSLTLDNIASVGSVYSETGCTATITDGAPVEVTGTWNNTTPAAFHGYYASIADTAKNLADTRLTDATITIKQNLALTNNETIPADVAVKTDNGVALTLSEGVILTISEGASFNGTVAGPDGASVALTGFVAGDDGATLTGGSVTISGTIDASSNVVIDASNGVYIEDVLVTSTTTTAGGLTITVTPDEEGVAPTVTITNVEIGNGASMSIENGANVELSGTISVAAAQGEQVAGSLDIAGAVTGTGSIFGAFTMAPNANVTVNYDDEDVQDYEGSYNALAEGITSGSGVTGTWSIEDDTLILDHYTGNLYFYTFNADGFSKVELIGENVIILDEAAVGEFFDPTQATRSYFGAIRTGATDGLTIQSTDGTGSLEIKISGSLGTMSGKHVAGIMASSVTINADVAVTNTMTADDGVTISTYGIKGGVDSAGDVTVGTGVTVNGDINADTLTMTDATVNGNTDANTFVFNGNVNIDSIEGSFTIGTYATVIVDDVVINAGEAITNNGGALIIMNSLSYTAATGAGNIMVYNGVAQQVLPNNIYLASGATFSGNVTPVPVENAVDGVIVNNVVDANREIALGNDVTIVSIDPVNIDGLVGADDVTVTIGTIYGTNNTLAGTIVTNNLGYKDSDNAIVSATINE